MTESVDPQEPRGGLLLLIDSEWASEEASDVPTEAVVGAWLVSPDGVRGPFQPNPVYRPSKPGSPLDPVDAVLGLLARGENGVDLLPSVLCDVMFGVAVDERGIAIVRPAPDDVPAVLVTTSYGHRDRVDAAGWRNVTLAQVASALPPRGSTSCSIPGRPRPCGYSPTSSAPPRPSRERRRPG